MSSSPPLRFSHPVLLLLETEAPAILGVQIDCEVFLGPVFVCAQLRVVVRSRPILRVSRMGR